MTDRGTLLVDDSPLRLNFRPNLHPDSVRFLAAWKSYEDAPHHAVAQRRCHTISGVSRSRNLLQLELLFYHEANLVFRCVTRPGNGFLDLPGRILSNHNLVMSSGQKNRTTGVSKLQSALNVLPLKYCLYRYRIRFMPTNQCAKTAS